MGNVFTIINEYEELINQIEELGGEITPELAEKLAITEQDLTKKIRAYYYVIKTKESEIQLAKDEQERLGDVRKTKENVIKRLKKMVDLAVEVFGTPKPSGAKGLDLGDLKVWQKKTEALELLGDIDDERFCNKQVSFTLTYEDAKYLLRVIEEEGKNFLVPTISNQIIKDKLKQWLIDNEEEHKKLLSEYKDKLKLPNIEFDLQFSENQNGKPITQEEVIQVKDIQILLNTNLQHNSTVIFK
jgi:hypothetical protein